MLAALGNAMHNPTHQEAKHGKLQEHETEDVKSSGTYAKQC
jgi:hypothetical protein